MASNLYDNQIYCFGKGKTAVEVSTSPSVVAEGSGVLIKGTVTDQSPGAVGTPAISDEDMGEWMEYLYMQKPMPTDAIGVPVLLQACDSDGNVVDIATVTSDMMGHYEYLWIPPDQGTYKILATFMGSESYWMSSAETAIGVVAAPAASGYQGPSATEVAQATVNMLPAYPDVPTASEVAQETVS